MAANKKKYASKPSAAARFMSTVHSDLLLEILIRLPRMGHAMTVCKSWHSLIISDHPKAFLRHTLRHNRRRQSCDPDPSYTPPCTLLFAYQPDRPWIQVLSEKSKVLEAALSRQSPPRNLLGFVSDLNYEAIKASFNDSLLIDLDGRYCIYNPVTQEQRLLPNPPWTDDSLRLKLMLVGREESNGAFRFRVVIFHLPDLGRSKTVLVYSSETGQWNESELNLYPPASTTCMVAAGGALYWLHRSSGIRVYDPFRPTNNPSSCRIVEYPFEPPDALNSCRILRFGAVRGRFRLLDAHFEEKEIWLRIWELKKGDDDDDEWSLVQEVWLETRMFSSLVAFHPEDGDVIFVSDGFSIYRCELKGKRFEKVGQVSTDKHRSIQHLNCFFRYLSLVHNSF